MNGLQSFIRKWRIGRTSSTSRRDALEFAPADSELFGAEQLARHARHVAAAHVVGEAARSEQLLPKLREDERIVQETCKLLSDALARGLRLAPAAEWLLDNAYLIEEQIVLARQHLPRGYSLELPQLSRGTRAGFPRVYDIAIELISHTDGRFDENDLSHFITAYQEASVLRLGELWAIPIMVRLALINSVRQVAQRLADNRKQRDVATEWAKRFINIARNQPKKLIVALADLVTEGPELSRAFVTELTIRLQGQHPSLGLVLQWLEHELAEQGQNIEQVLHSDSQATASDQASISNSITGLRAVSSVDWPVFVEAHSAVDKVLQSDPAGVYAKMDFGTRDSYRHVVEKLRRRSDRTEQQIAEKAVELAESAGEQTDDARLFHVGYYLIDDGLPTLKDHIAYRSTGWELFSLTCSRSKGSLYVGSVALISFVLVGAIGYWAMRQANMPLWMIAAAAAPILLLIAQAAIALSNWLVLRIARPRQLPRMNYFDGIPADRKTAVAVPTLLTSHEGVRELIDMLEVRYLANRDPQLSFVLLTDLPDADAETLPSDEALISEAVDGIRRLNRKYVRADEPFLLLHRPRQWNKAERTWMGHERKRGKVTDFNTYLAHGDPSPFSVTEGDLDRLSDTRYVIVLDSDTQLPPQSAWKLVGTLAHPLNEAHIDAHRRIVDRGYGLLQPRVSASLAGGWRSHYAQLFSADVGIDPYTRVVSDLYQDLFGRASFVGKGIFDVRAFDTCLADRFPSNTVLSHDLLEGIYTRCGFVSDVELIEDQPARYTSDIARHHRWIRGDWQITGWLLSFRQPLSLLSRWKILDNLRRSVMPPAALAMLMLGWLLLPQPLTWTILTLGLILLPGLWMAIVAVVCKSQDTGWRLHLIHTAKKQSLQLTQSLLRIVFLPFEAAIHLDAIGRTFWRKLISHRHLLAWQTAAEAERRARTSLGGVTRTMWVGPFIAVALGIADVMLRPNALPVALPLLIAWFIAPVVAWWLSKPLEAEQAKLNPRDVQFLRKIARRTWHFYERFINDRTHWLPPDNYQEKPVPRLAERTSPTNIGMAALCSLSAWDFGYLSSAALLDRTDKMFDTLDKLERYRGHFYNWYTTDTLQPLPPRYISTVDSGNMSVWLIVMAQGLHDLPHQPLLPAEWLSGLQDTARVLREEIAAVPANAIGAHTSLDRTLDWLLSHPQRDAMNAAESRAILDRLCLALDEAKPAFPDDDSALRHWFDAMRDACHQFRDDLSHFVPWSIPGESQLSELTPALSAAGASPAQRAGIYHHLFHIPTLNEQAHFHESFGDMLAGVSLPWLRDIVAQSQLASDRARRRIDAMSATEVRCRDLAAMDYQFLFNPRLRLFCIGYHVDRHQMDSGHYDLLATEPRLASYVAIAQNQVPMEHWFLLRRTLTPVGNRAALVSWSGSMFEYLMPLLVMPTYRGTLLDETYRAVIRAQIDHGRAFGIPWGVSESGYNLVDAALNYQYRAFGVPALGLNRGLTDDLVVAPYAAAMALMVRPTLALKNLQLMSRKGFIGTCGLYEAVDYSPRRLPEGRDHAVVYSFMVHHAGMSFLSLAYALLSRPMQRRFVAEPEFRSTLLLLQERVPTAEPTIATLELQTQESESRQMTTDARPAMRVYTNPAAPAPQVALLGNSRYHVMLSTAGGGYSKWNDLLLTRWRADRTQDHWGQFCYVRDVDRNHVWSVTHQPVCEPTDHYQAIFSQGRVEFIRSDDQIETHTQISVSPEDDVEVRRVRVRNLSRVRRRIELTTYSEVVLVPQPADMAHRAFSNLFVETQLLRSSGAILITRRPRAAEEKPPFMFHLTTGDESWGPAGYETDRAVFIGRGRTPRHPQAMEQSGPLTDSAGAVLDPIMSIRRSVELEPGESAELLIVTGAAETREQATGLIDKYADRRLGERAYETAWTHNQVLLQQIGAASSDTPLFNELAAALIYPDGTFRASPAVIKRNRRGQSGLWGQSISGDWPIILLTVTDFNCIELVNKVAQAHIWWRAKGLRADLVIVVDENTGQRQPLIDRITGHLHSTGEASYLDKPGGVYVRGADKFSEDDFTLLQAVAMLTLHDRAGSLADQAERTPRTRTTVAPLKPTRITGDDATGTLPPRDDLLFFNGLGGFTKDGKEYVIRLEPGQSTPAPWSNVIANGLFGCIVTESGQSYTWAENAHELRLTPWHNDPVTDSSGEAFYIRDEVSGRFWSPGASPARGNGPYLCRHGLGYTIHEHDEAGIYCQATTYVATDAPVKFVAFKLRNHSGRSRKLSVTGYVEWVLGEHCEKTDMHVVTRLDPRTGAVLATNAYNQQFPGRVAFAHCYPGDRTYTCDRTEFIGRNGSLASPQAMKRQHLSNRVGAALDPCAAIQSPVEIPDGEERQIVFMLGAGKDEPEALSLLQRFRGTGAAQQALEAVWNQWNRLLGAVHIETPDPALNVLVNYWMLYQAIACRLWGRSGYYQSGGAFGFRDQLQDTLSLLHNAPWLLREQLVLCAGRQFREGDVQHWWHPPDGRGVRTHFSDDYLWLPYGACRYVNGTGDTGLLDEEIAFLEGRPLRDDEESYYELPKIAEERASFYDHCVRAIRRGIDRIGEHGLPLMGCGDWNDGMNKIGEHGKGESVWLAFFLYDILRQFAPIAAGRNDEPFVQECENAAEMLRKNIESHCWDGDWYLRAFFDDGTPLGGKANDECQIDSLSQSWSVISGAGEARHAASAMQAVDQRLVDDDLQLVRLFDPAFVNSPLNPGYIKGYIQGVRENGGQYTHAAVWATIAFAMQRNVRRAWDCFRYITPIGHTQNDKQLKTYKVEPYVIAADIYTNPQHPGRGGWTWYTGAAGWTFRLMFETLLGVKLEVDKLTFAPVLPEDWKEYRIHYRYRETAYRIQFRITGPQTWNVRQVSVDGAVQQDSAVHLIDDRRDHQVEVDLG